MGSMIVSFFLYAMYYALDFIITPIKILPDVVLDSGIGGAINDGASALATFNAFIPLTALFAVVASILLVELIVLLYKLIMWALRRLPTQS